MMLSPFALALYGFAVALVLFGAWLLAASRAPRSRRGREGGWRS